MAKKQIGTIAVTIISLIMLGAYNHVLAQNMPLACQVEAAGGLKWEDGKWKTVSFTKNKFILVLKENTLKAESASKAMHLNSPTECSKVALGRISCLDQFGGYLLFDPKTLRGTVTRISGGADADSQSRDTVSVEVFTCESF